LIIARDFNIRDSDWDPFYLFHSIHSDSLLEVADSLNLKLSSPIQQVSTHYSNNRNNINLVINLFFLWLNSIKINNHIVFSELWYSSNYTLLTVNIFISEGFIQDKRWTIIKNSKEEEIFISDLIKAIGCIDIITILDKETLEDIVQKYTNISETTWHKYLRYINITK